MINSWPFQRFFMGFFMAFFMGLMAWKKYEKCIKKAWKSCEYFHIHDPWNLLHYAKLIKSPWKYHESLLMQGPKFHGLFMVNVLCHENKTWIFMVLNLMGSWFSWPMNSPWMPCEYGNIHWPWKFVYLFMAF